MTAREAWTQSYSINVTSTHLFTHALVPLLLKSSNPKIIFISSMVGSIANQANGVLGEMDQPRKAGWPKEPGFNPTSYRVSKAAFNMMCREWHRTLVNDGVKVYVLAMGGYATELAGQDPVKALENGSGDPKVAGEWVRGFVEGEHEGEEGKYMAIHGEQPW
jgi:NAD(P)-dependent dehydrogenase (short-subunit alcohol dehydrogenase family)